MSLAEEDRARRGGRAGSPGRNAALRESKAIRRDLPRFLERLSAGSGPLLAGALASLDQLARLFATINKQKPNHYPPGAGCRRIPAPGRGLLGADRLLRGRETLRFAHALAGALGPSSPGSAGRETGSREPTTRYRQFHSLVRHLIARYDVPAFMNTAWLEGLAEAGVVHQRWFIHVAQGET